MRCPRVLFLLFSTEALDLKLQISSVNFRYKKFPKYQSWEGKKQKQADAPLFLIIAWTGETSKRLFISDRTPGADQRNAAAQVQLAKPESWGYLQKHG